MREGGGGQEATVTRQDRWAAGVAVAAVLALAGIAVWIGLASWDDGAAPGGSSSATEPAPSATASAPATESPSPQAPTSAPASAPCTVEYVVLDSWPDGFTVDVTVRNLGEPLDGWELAWRFDGDERIENLWNAELVAPGEGESRPGVVLRDAGHNAALATGAEVTFGFVGSGAATVAPAEVRLDGRLCGPAPDDDALPDDEAPADAAPPAPGGPGTTARELYRHDASRAVTAASAARGETRRLLEKISTTPHAVWVTDASPATAASTVREYTTKAAADGGIGLLVLYAVPGRDCGQHSSGGVAGSAYAKWIDAVADAVVGEPWIVLEPDALAMLGDCDGQGDRVGYLRYAATALAAAGARVYLDVGHSGWHSPEEAARRLKLVGLDHVAGFALNVSNFQTTADSIAYGEKVAASTDGARYVIDTSRNGNGSDGSWCNPRGRALGERPRLVDDGTHLDALLWVKPPGESDGTCNGGPASGQWFEEMALELARNAHW